MSDEHDQKETGTRNHPGPAAEITSVDRVPEDIDLKSLRKTRGLTLKDIFTVTRITVSSLEAIEEGHYNLLPEPVYAKTFIKTYARILGTDSKPILQQYENYLKSLDEIHEDRKVDHKERPRKDKKIKKGHLPWIILASLLLALIAWSLLFYINDFMNLFSTRNTSSQKVASSIKTEHTAPAAVNAPTGPQPPAVTKPEQAPSNQNTANQKRVPSFNLKIEAAEKTWLRISTDQKQPEQMMLLKGDKVELTARESFVMDIGNAGGVLVSFQDQPLPPLGKRGEIKHLRLP